MATIRKEKNGRKSILVCCPDGKRRTIRLGKIDMKGARDVKHQIEAISARQWGGASLTVAQVEWLTGLSEKIYERLSSAGIAPVHRRIDQTPQVNPLESFANGYIDRRTDLAAATVKKYKGTVRLLVEHFGSDRDLATITRADAKGWQRWLRSYVWKPATDTAPAETYAEATVSKHTKRAKTLFTEAVDARLITENPLDAVKAAGEINRDRDFFIDSATASKILDTIGNPVYRLAFALARFGGLRQCEILHLRWSDMVGGKIRVESPKTGLRFVPVFTKLKPVIDEASKLKAGPESRCMGHLAASTNLGVQTKRFIQQAGVTPWPKTYQNLRASRRTELEETYPPHVCDAWMGHSSRVAKESYLQVTEEHWSRATAPAKKAAQNPAQ